MSLRGGWSARRRRPRVDDGRAGSRRWSSSATCSPPRSSTPAWSTSGSSSPIALDPPSRRRRAGAGAPGPRGATRESDPSRKDGVLPCRALSGAAPVMSASLSVGRTDGVAR